MWANRKYPRTLCSCGTAGTPPPVQRTAQVAAGGTVADALGEVDHVLVPHVGQDGVNHDQVRLVEVDRVLTIDARVAGPEDHLARPRVDQPSMLVVGLVRQRGSDLLNIDRVQVEHPVSV